MQSLEKNGLVFIRMFPGENFYTSLEEACKKHSVQSAVVLSSLGQLKDFKLGYFVEKGDYSPQEFSEPHELISVSGVIHAQDEKHEFHLHAALGNRGKQTVSGHLIEGIVEITNETVLLKSDAVLNRKEEEETGLRGLFLD